MKLLRKIVHVGVSHWQTMKVFDGMDGLPVDEIDVLIEKEIVVESVLNEVTLMSTDRLYKAGTSTDDGFYRITVQRRLRTVYACVQAFGCERERIVRERC